MSEYSFETDLDVRFRDIDAMRHVNNAVYATYLEQTRVEYYATVLGLSLDELDTVLASLSIDFRRPIKLGDDVSVSARTSSMGESSLEMAYEIRANGEVAATGTSVQVVIDRETERSRPIPDEWRETIEAYEASPPE